MADGAAPLRGRQAQAAHNDELILRAAREVFLRMSSSLCAASWPRTPTV
jgi:hypothetical protein